MADWVIGTEQFNKNLDTWLFKSEQKNADWLYKNRNKIPPTFRNYSQILYRGMTVDGEFLEQLNSGKLTLTNHTSWTKDEKNAKKFVSGKGYMFTKNKGVSIIISKKIPSAKQIIDIDTFVLFMGIDQLEMMGFDETNLDSAVKEKEVLIAKSIKITQKDVKFV